MQVWRRSPPVVDMVPEKPLVHDRLQRPAIRRAVAACAVFAIATGSALACWIVFRAPARTTAKTSSGSVTADRARETNAEPQWRGPSGYTGSQACRTCHREQYETYRLTAHSRALTDVVPDQEPGNAVFDHPPSGRRYRVTRRDGQLIHEESLRLDAESDFRTASLPVRFRVGSGHFGRTYLC